MKVLIELRNIAVENISSKFITPSETVGEAKVEVKMYWKCTDKNIILNFSQ